MISQISPCGPLVALSLLVSTVGTVAELEPPEQSCLLQTKESKEQQLVVQEQAPPGYVVYCSGDCQCTSTSTTAVSLGTCANNCAGSPGFNWGIVNLGTLTIHRCKCCASPATLSNQVVQTSLYMRVFQPPPGYDFKCGPFCRCTDFFGSETFLSIDECAAKCASERGFIYVIYDPFGPPTRNSDCQCCNNLEEAEYPDVTRWYLYAPSGAGALGDPHISTFDGQRYTLLSQGSFSLWHFSGVETNQTRLQEPRSFPWIGKRPLFRAPFTKGLLLIDKSGGAVRQVVEITSQDCKWKARKGNEELRVVDPVDKPERISVPDGTDFVTGFDLSSWQSLSQPRALQHEHQAWHIRHCGPEPQLPAQPQPQCPNLDEPQE